MKYEEIEVGESARDTKWITPAIVDEFIDICGDNNSVHVKGAKPIVHGMLVSAFISKLIGKQLPGDGAIWKTYSASFIRPVYVWDKIVIIGTVHTKNDLDNSVVMTIDVFNENDELCLASTATVKVTA